MIFMFIKFRKKFESNKRYLCLRDSIWKDFLEKNFN